MLSCSFGHIFSSCFLVQLVLVLGVAPLVCVLTTRGSFLDVDSWGLSLSCLERLRVSRVLCFLWDAKQGPLWKPNRAWCLKPKCFFWGGFKTPKPSWGFFFALLKGFDVWKLGLFALPATICQRCEGFLFWVSEKHFFWKKIVAQTFLLLGDLQKALKSRILQGRGTLYTHFSCSDGCLRWPINPREQKLNKAGFSGLNPPKPKWLQGLLGFYQLWSVIHACGSWSTFSDSESPPPPLVLQFRLRLRWQLLLAVFARLLIFGWLDWKNATLQIVHGSYRGLVQFIHFCNCGLVPWSSVWLCLQSCLQLWLNFEFGWLRLGTDALSLDATWRCWKKFNSAEKGSEKNCEEQENGGREKRIDGKRWKKKKILLPYFFCVACVPYRFCCFFA